MIASNYTAVKKLAFISWNYTQLVCFIALFRLFNKNDWPFHFVVEW